MKLTVSLLSFSILCIFHSCTVNKAKINDDLKKHFDVYGELHAGIIEKAGIKKR